MNIPAEKQLVQTAKRWRWMGSPLFASLTERAAGDEDLKAMVAAAPEGQPGAFLLLSAVHWLVLKNPGLPLGRYLASVTEDPLIDEEGAYQAFREMCRTQRARILDVMQTHTLQLTLAGRAAFVLPLASYVARRAGEPLSFIEIGCSAGLLTNFDQYSYDYGPGGRIDGPESMRLSSLRWIGPPPVQYLQAAPNIRERVGIDLHAVDPANPDERSWIEAILPPEAKAERAELRAALELRMRKPFQVIEGDALGATPPLLSKLADPILVLAAHCLYQWPAAARDALDQVFRNASGGRAIYLLRIDHPQALDPNAVPAPSPADPNEAPVLHEASLTIYRDGETEQKLLARYDSYGRKAIWLADD